MNPNQAVTHLSSIDTVSQMARLNRFGSVEDNAVILRMVQSYRQVVDENAKLRQLLADAQVAIAATQPKTSSGPA